MNKVKSLGFYQIQGSFKFVEEECVFVFGRQARVHNICIVNTSLHCMWLNIIKRKSKRLLGQKMIIHDFFLARHNYKTLFKKVSSWIMIKYNYLEKGKQCVLSVIIPPHHTYRKCLFSNEANYTGPANWVNAIDWWWWK